MSDFFTRIGATAIAQNTSAYFYMPDMATLAIDTSAVSSGTYKVYGAMDYDPAMVDPTAAHWVPLATIDSAGVEVAANSAVTPSTTKTVFASVATYTGIKITEQNAGTVTVMVAGSKCPISDVLAGAAAVTADTELPAAAALADNTATPTAPAVGAFGMVYDGSTWDMLRGNSVIGVQVGHGKTLKTYSATISADTDVIAAVSTKRIKVFAYSIINIDNTADTVIFKSNGTGGTELWRVYLRGPDANTPYGANLATSAPSFLFATVAGEKLTVDVSAAATLHISIAYWDDDVS